MNLNQCDRGDDGGRQKDRGGKDDFAGWVVIMARNPARGRWLVNSFEADVPQFFAASGTLPGADLRALS